MRRSPFAFVVLLTLLLTSASVAAQTPKHAGPSAKVVHDPRSESPSLMPPVYYMLAPGALLSIVGAILWWQYDPRDGSAALYNAATTFTIVGPTMVAGSLPYLGARIAKRRLWQLQRRWLACGLQCNLSEPKVYHGLYMLGPGVVLTLAGGGFLFHTWWRAASTASDDPELRAPLPSLVVQRLAIASFLLGTTLVIAGAVHMAARLRLRAAWRQRSGALSTIRVLPQMAMRPGAVATYSAGLVMSAQF